MFHKFADSYWPDAKPNTIVNTAVKQSLADHGTASPMLVMGKGVKADLHGKHPSFHDLDNNGDLKMTTDSLVRYDDSRVDGL